LGGGIRIRDPESGSAIRKNAGSGSVSESMRIRNPVHIILELANKFGLAIDKNTLKEMTFSKAKFNIQPVICLS
jgi:hypothetical protein